MSSEKNKIYCSLDIETSGFDPLKDEILEVGFVVFKIEDLRFKIEEEWTQVFKPSKAVGPQILGLTGISQQELDEAPKFAESRDFLQEKLGKAVIVGHNVVFDIKFLEAFGIKLSGEVIDTLDLVQWLLPTHHSYNLENLMHTFDIKHKEAHRALADSKAALKLLEKLFQLFSGFPVSLKKTIKDLLKPYNFVWKDFLNISFPPISFKDFNENKFLKSRKTLSPSLLNLQPKLVYNFSLGQNYIEQLVSALKKGKSKSLLVLPKAQQVLQFVRQRLVDKAVFLPELEFDEKKFLVLLKKPDLSADELKFVLKILVWQNTNWQTKTLLDLNLSFFGGQFKGLVTGGKTKENKTAQILGLDQDTFLELPDPSVYKNRQVVICGLNEFEASVTANIGSKSSWGYITYLLKSFYNFEFSLGQEKFKAPVEEALASSDLFFGLINALLQTDPPSFQYYKIAPEVEYEENYQKIKGAAANYVAKLLKQNEILQSNSVKEFANSLAKFFIAEDNKVKWIEIAENRCSLLSMPVDIKELVSNIIKPFPYLSFADVLGPELLSKFFIKRLGLKDFSLETVREKDGDLQKTSKIIQGDLFSSLKKVFTGKKEKINYHCLPHTVTTEELLQLFGKDSSLPGAILFGRALQAREFYEQNYQELKQRASLWAQSGHGGSNKIFRNFTINKHSLLLATDKFILKATTGQTQVEQVSRLPVKVLILCRLPFEQFTHPYQEAVSQALPNAFMDYSLPRALLNFQNLINFFYTPLLKDIYIIDDKLNKEYALVFKDYYKFIPGAELKS